jgi:hypothetical protein
MTQPTFTQVRVALATRIAAGTGIRAHHSFRDVTPPAAVVMPIQGAFMTYGVTFDGQVNWHLNVILLVSSGDDKAGQDAMDAILSTTGSKSVTAAIQADPTLGGVVSSTVPVEATGYGLMNVNGVEYLGCSFTVEIEA